MTWFHHPGMRASLEAMFICAAGIALLSVWAALSRRRWFVRALVPALLLLVLVPIRAAEPLALFAVVAPATVLAIRLQLRRLKSPLVVDAEAAVSRNEFRRIGLRLLLFCVAVLVILWGAGLPRPLQWTWYEALAFFAVAASLAAVTVILFRLQNDASETVVEQRKGNSADIAARSSLSRVRFSLRDVLELVLIAALLSAALAAIRQSLPQIDWLGLLGTAVCLVLITLAAVFTVLLRRRWVIAAAALVLAVGASAALHAWALSDWTGVFMQMAADQWEGIFVVFLAAFAFFAMLQMVCLFLGSLASAAHGTLKDKRQAIVRRSARIALTCTLLAVFGPLAVLYWRMLQPPLAIEDSLPATNNFPQVVAAVNRLSAADAGRLTVEERESAYRDLMRLLENPAYVPLDLERDGREDYVAEQMEDSIAVRNLGRALQGESAAAAMAGRHDRAADFGLANLRMGGMLQRGGILIQSLIGIAVEATGVSQAASVRGELSIEQTRRMLAALQAIDQGREPPAVTIARDVAWSNRAFTWRITLLRDAPVVLGGEDAQQAGVSLGNLGAVQAFQDAARRRDAMLRLLATDLAIRLYRQDHGEAPVSLTDLCPDYLDAVPVDPFSDQPLVYRRDNDSFYLYSVWKDGDNGGRFGGWTAVIGGSNYDLDLDINQRPVAATAPPTPAPAASAQ